MPTIPKTKWDHGRIFGSQHHTSRVTLQLESIPVKPSNIFHSKNKPCKFCLEDWCWTQITCKAAQKSSTMVTEDSPAADFEFWTDPSVFALIQFIVGDFQATETISLYRRNEGGTQNVSNRAVSEGIQLLVESEPPKDTNARILF